jgi:hypothetical protein
MRATLYYKLISGAKILIEEADKANQKGDAERRAFMLNDCVEFLTNGLKKQGDLRKAKPT